MKFYSYYTDKEDICDDASTYITNYRIENDEIIVTYATKEEIPFPYSESRENQLLNRMEEQVKEVGLRNILPTEKILAIFGSLAAPFVINLFIKDRNTLNMILMVYLTTNAIYYPIKIVGKMIDNVDVHRIRLFLENKELLNKYIREGYKVTRGVSKKTIRIIEERKQENKDAFNINILEKYPLRDLKRIRNNIIKNYGEEAKEMILTKKLENS